MNRKRILRWVAAACLLVLAACTGVSYFVYDALLPRVEVLDFLVRDTPDPTDYGAEWWVPESCIQSRDENGRVTIYRVRSRDGIFGIEYFVEAGRSLQTEVIFLSGSASRCRLWYVCLTASDWSGSVIR